MKINPEIPLNEILPKNIQESANSAENVFNDILNKKIEDLNVPESGLEPGAALHRTQNLLLIPPVEETEVVSRLEKFLDTLQEYTEKLDNPYFTPKDISSLISKIETDNADLSVLSASISDNKELKEIIDEVVIRSATEVIKFNRGDYL